MLASLSEADRLEACGDDPSPICEWVADRTDSVALARTADVALDLPLQILLVVVVALIAARVGRRLVVRSEQGLGSCAAPMVADPTGSGRRWSADSSRRPAPDYGPA